MFKPPSVQNISISATYSSSGGTDIVLNASAVVPTALMQIFAIDTIKVGSTSTIQWGSMRLRMAMVLDNMGSMQQSGKMDALKTAAT